MKKYSPLLLIAAFIFLGISACAAETSKTALPDDPAALEQHIEEMAADLSCDQSAQCRSLPIGQKACGGPREYMMYSAKTTIEGDIIAAAERLQKLEDQANRENNMMSNCMMVLPPEPICRQGVCQRQQ